VVGVWSLYEYVFVVSCCDDVLLSPPSARKPCLYCLASLEGDSLYCGSRLLLYMLTNDLDVARSSREKTECGERRVVAVLWEGGPGGPKGGWLW